MKSIFSIFLIIIVVCSACGQKTHIQNKTLYYDVDINSTINKRNDTTELICQTATMKMKFKMPTDIIIRPERNIVEIDSQMIQIALLHIVNDEIEFNNINLETQKQLLNHYSEYEIDYFKNKLHIELSEPQYQWLDVYSRGWLIWYFKGVFPQHNTVVFQLFATTIIFDNVLVLNAPVVYKDDSFIENDSQKAAIIVDKLMESIEVKKL